MVMIVDMRMVGIMVGIGKVDGDSCQRVADVGDNDADQFVHGRVDSGVDSGIDSTEDGV